MDAISFRYIFEKLAAMNFRALSNFLSVAETGSLKGAAGVVNIAQPALTRQIALLEEEFGVPVPHGYVVRLPDDTVDRVQIDGPLRDLTLKTMDALRTMMRSERMPPASPLLARCVDCEYRVFCGDIV